MTPSENRVKQLAMLAYDGDRLVGISTLNIRHFEQVRQTIAFFREVVHPDYRRKQVGRFLGRKTYKLIEEYALAHPEEKIGGMGAIYQAPGIGQRAVTREARLALIGYTKRNEQVRIAWFPHFMVPPNAPSA
jgi:GNAT superfamily N-acetyltransferase